MVAAGRAVRPALASAGLAIAALGVGAAYAVGAYAAGPLHALGALIAAPVLAAAAWRPQVGVAVALGLAALARVIPDASVLSLAASALVVALVVVVVARREPVGTSRRDPSAPLAFALAALLATTLIAVAGSSEQNEAVGFLRALLTGLGLAFVASRVAREHGGITWFLGAAGVAAILVGGGAVAQHLRGGGLSDGFLTGSGQLIARASGGFQQPNQLAGFLVVLVPLCVAGAILQRRWRLPFAFAAAIAAYGVYASFSRSALIALLVVPFAFLPRRRLLVVVPLLAIFALTVTPDLLRERFATVTQSGSELATRTDMWRTSLAMWQERPVLGVGLAEFPEAYANARVPGKRFLPSTAFLPPPHAHNLALHLLVEQGILGLLALVAVLGSAIALARRLRRSPERSQAVVGTAGLALLAAFIVHNAFDVTLFQTETALFLWATLGVLAGAAAGDARTHADRP